MDTAVRFVQTHDGVRIAYTMHGGGPPLVFVRGWISHLGLLWDDSAFRAFVQALAQHFTVVRYDARGNGLSERTTTATLDSLVLDLEAVVEQVASTPFVLYGATFGAVIAAIFTARHPTSVAKLILEGTFARGAAITTPERQEALITMLRRFPEQAFVLLGYATHPDSPQTAYRRPEWAQQMISAETAAVLYSLAFQTDITEVLRRIKVPTLVLHRAGSQSIPVRLGREVAALISTSKFIELEGSAHNGWEGDANSTLREIGAFLDVAIAPVPSADTARTTSPVAQRVPSKEIIGSKQFRYQLLTRISEGRMGVVWKAFDAVLNRPVAIKFLPEPLAAEADAKRRFQREVRAASVLVHPSICTVFDVGEHEREPFIVMELLDGRTLKQTIGRRPLDGVRLLRWASQIADALIAAHKAGIIHRDLKSSNVQITSHGDAKILDFGLAKFVSDEKSTHSTLTKAGSPLGTWSYMSPEQVRGEPLDARSDIFSLGMVLYEMAVGRLPFAGESIPSIIDQMLSPDRIEIPVLAPDIPAELSPILERALEKTRTRRYQSAADLRADIELLKMALKPSTDQM